MKIFRYTAFVLVMLFPFMQILGKKKEKKKNGQAEAPFSRIVYMPTEGRVGYHMVSKPRYYYDDLPTPTCSPTTQFPDITVKGEVPPGVNAPTDSQRELSDLEKLTQEIQGRAKSFTFNFEGTPEQPGDWDVRVTLYGLHCKDDDSKNYGDRSFSVHFHIEGDAPRKVH